VRGETPGVVINFVSELTLSQEASGFSAAPIDNDVADFVDYCEDIALQAESGPSIAIDFSKNGSAAHFTRQGWGHTEDRLAWMIGAESVIESPPLPADAGQARLVAIEIELFPVLLPGAHRQQRLAISVEKAWGDLGDFAIVGEGTIRASLPISDIPRDEPWRINFFHSDGFPPSSVSDGADRRVPSIRAALLSRRGPAIFAPIPETEANAKRVPIKRRKTRARKSL
jgi:hypothetical protein